VCVFSLFVRFWDEFLTLSDRLPSAHQLRQSLDDIRSALPRLIGIFSLLFFVILLWSMMATVLYHGTRQGDEIFPDFVDTLIQFFILVTTANCEL
jgi:hypothetical protein